MQREITDDAALAFSEAFYRRIAAGDPVDVAVTEGRQAIRDSDPGRLEWSTPALFMRAPDGILFRKWPSPRWVVVRLVAIALGIALIWSGYDRIRHAEAVEHNNRGAILLDNGQIEQAHRAFRAALDADSDLATAYNNLARADSRGGRYRRAIEGYSKAIELDGNNAIYHYNLGASQLELGERLEAAQNLRRALELDHDYLPAYNELAKVYRELKRFEDARGTLEQALTRSPDEGRPEFLAPLFKNLGQVEMADGNPAAATGHFHSAHSRYPQSDVADLAEISILLAKAYGELNESVQVCHWLDQAQRYAPDFIGRWRPRDPENLATDHGCSLGSQVEERDE